VELFVDGTLKPARVRSGMSATRTADLTELRAGAERTPRSPKIESTHFLMVLMSNVAKRLDAEGPRPQWA